MNTKVTKLPKSEVEIEGELEADLFEGYYAQALKKLGENVNVDGFRKGKVPENVLVTKIPEISILEEMAQIALNDVYPKILEEEKIDAISRPEIAITKLARKNPLGFKIKTAVLPEIKLPDYKKIAQSVLRSDLGNSKRSDLEVSDEEVENTIMDIRKSRAPKVKVSDTQDPVSDTLNLPEFNDEFVKGLGPFENIADFKEKLKVNIELEKKNQAKEKVRINMIEKIIENSTLEVPEILIDIELDKILYKMESDITAMGLEFEGYLKHINKTKEDLRKEFRKDGEKKAKLALILQEIAKVENITAPEEQVAQEVAHILEHYKDADPERARAHAENVLTNEKIFEFLENQ
ncbi:MAG TPA: trigger factor [Candidatus Paceibacterota bacterium]